VNKENWISTKPGKHVLAKETNSRFCENSITQTTIEAEPGLRLRGNLDVYDAGRDHRLLLVSHRAPGLRASPAPRRPTRPRAAALPSLARGHGLLGSGKLDCSSRPMTLRSPATSGPPPTGILTTERRRSSQPTSTFAIVTSDLSGGAVVLVKGHLFTAMLGFIRVVQGVPAIVPIEALEVPVELRLPETAVGAIRLPAQWRRSGAGSRRVGLGHLQRRANGR
jgi:hypothetical protein